MGYEDEMGRDVMAKHESRYAEPVGKMNRTPGNGPVAEALSTLDDAISGLEEIIERHIVKIEPVVGPDLADGDPDSQDEEKRPQVSNVRFSIENKISRVTSLKRRLGRITERVEL